MRGAGGGGAAGRCAIGAAGAAFAETTGDAAADGTGAAGGGIAGRGAVLNGEGAAIDAEGEGDEAEGAEAAGGVATTLGLTTAGATTSRAGGAGAAGGATADAAGDASTGRLPNCGAAGFSIGGCALGAGAVGGAAGREDTAGTSFFWVIAFSTSPGREMCDRSILVLISSSPRLGRELLLPPAEEPSAEERMYTRTFSASCSSRELECVFFSVTPTNASVSRMALLLTSSSRARSLIRTLLIRPFVSPRFS